MTPTTLGRFNSAQYVQAMRAQTGPIVQLGDAASRPADLVWGIVGVSAIALGIWAAFYVTLHGTRYAR